jgi:hypothetical protein
VTGIDRCKPKYIAKEDTIRLSVFAVNDDVRSRNHDAISLVLPLNPDFLYAAPDTTAGAAFIKESRMNLANANKLYRKSGGSRSMR